jgi:hypothetical protein
LSELKVEVLLPLKYNPDEKGKRKKIEGKKYRETFAEVAEKFPDYTVDNSPLLGNWINPKTKKKVIDENKSFFVICEASKANLAFFRKLKKTLKKRFLQDDILIYHIEVFRY